MPISLDAKFSDTPLCQSCGRRQLADNDPRCRICGSALVLPVIGYRRNRAGEWERIRELNLTIPLPHSEPRPRLRRLHRFALLVLLSSLPGGMLWGWSWKLQREVTQHESAAATRQAEGRGIILARLEATVDRVGKGRLVILGSTNLPDGTVLEARFLRGETVLARDYPIVVQDRAFRSSEMANRGKPFHRGEYDVQIVAPFGSTQQSDAVFAVVGPRGRKLIGPLIESNRETPPAKQIAFRGTVSLW